MRGSLLIAKSVLIEAVRRREVYAIVLISTLIIGAVMTVDFFNVEGLTKFYREMALKIMSTATALTTVVLAARQLPREFENRTIYPLMAKPISRVAFLWGKLLGVQAAALFCFALFMAIYVAGATYLGTPVPAALFAQYIYLQMLMMLVLSTLSFWLSMLFNLDAAITLAAVMYFGANILTSAVSEIYDHVGRIQQLFLLAVTFLVPQLTLFDLSGKAVHSSAWGPLDAAVMLKLSAYGAVFAIAYFGAALWCFRRRPL